MGKMGTRLLDKNARKLVACEQALGRMEGERKEERLYAHLKFTVPPLF